MILNCKEKFTNFVKNKSNKKYLIASVATLGLIVSLVGVSTSSCYKLSVNDETVAYANSKQTITTAVDMAKDEVLANLDIDANITLENMEITSVHKPFAKKLSTQDLANALSTNENWQATGSVLDINNGESVFCFLKEEEGQAVIDTLTNEAIAQNANCEIVSTAFMQDYTLENENVDLNEVTTTAQALEEIKEGKDTIKTHVVSEGETLWDIASSNNISVDELQELNPNVSETKMQIGQELKLNAVEPLLSVVVNKIVTVDEAIAYGEIVKESSSLLKGETKVATQGENGNKQVTYQISEASGQTLDKVVLNEVVTKQPVDKVVTKGTASIATASRGVGGSLSWPVSAKITSPYGTRSSGFHTGIDLGAKTGTTVAAAAGGKVTLASYSGGYGYCVLIDHGNGLVTRYAHLSKISCSVGDTVLRGEKIGAVGSTGNSTGPHLHFEVIVNGSTKNPVNYLK